MLLKEATDAARLIRREHVRDRLGDDPLLELLDVPRFRDVPEELVEADLLNVEVLQKSRREEAVDFQETGLHHVPPHLRELLF